MVLGDKIAIGILIFCIVLGALGTFKWLLHLFAGVVCGLLILVCVGLLANSPRFDKLSGGVFKHGVVIPYIRNQITTIQDLISHTHEASSDEIAIRVAAQESESFAGEK